VDPGTKKSSSGLGPNFVRLTHVTFEMYTLIYYIWNKGLPQQWKESNILSIHKNGDKIFVLHKSRRRGVVL